MLPINLLKAEKFQFRNTSGRMSIACNVTNCGPADLCILYEEVCKFCLRALLEGMWSRATIVPHNIDPVTGWKCVVIYTLRLPYHREESPYTCR
jgi:hypothetical protein